MRTCPKCGAESKKSSAFCPLCFSVFEQFSYTGTNVVDPDLEQEAMIRVMAMSDFSENI